MSEFTQVDGFDFMEVSVRYPMPWSSRIPAAIAKAEKLLEQDKKPFPECPNHMRGNHPHSDACIGFFRTRRSVKEFTATEVALAKGFLHAVETDAEFGGQYEQLPALIAFAEKVESLQA